DDDRVWHSDTQANRSPIRRRLKLMPGWRNKVRRGYSGGRPDVARMLVGAERVLDVGCGAGGLADRLRRNDPDVQVFGVEPDADLARLATSRMTEVIHGSVDDDRTIQ